MRILKLVLSYKFYYDYAIGAKFNSLQRQASDENYRLYFWVTVSMRQASV